MLETRIILYRILRKHQQNNQAEGERNSFKKERNNLYMKSSDAKASI